MKKITLPNGSYIEWTWDEDENEIILEMIESHQKGDGTRLMELFLKKTGDKKIGLCAYPQDATIDGDRLIAFYEKFGFSVDEDNGDGAIMSR